MWNLTLYWFYKIYENLMQFWEKGEIISNFSWRYYALNLNLTECFFNFGEILKSGLKVYIRLLYIIELSKFPLLDYQESFSANPHIHFMAVLYANFYHILLVKLKIYEMQSLWKLPSILFETNSIKIWNEGNT